MDEQTTVIINKRTVSKFVLRALVASAAGGVVTKSLITVIPATDNYDIAEITGAVVGFIVSGNLTPQIDKLVDDFYDKREMKAALNAPKHA